MSQLADSEDEINLAELLASLWYNWWALLFSFCIAVALAAYYVFVVATPQFEASTRFELLDKESGAGSLGQAASLAAFAGVNLDVGVSEADTLKDRILSRPFIEDIYEKADFINDPIFNYRLRKPKLTARIKTWVFGQGEIKEPSRDDYLVMVIASLNLRMFLDPGENGIIELKIRHPDPRRAALVANLIVEKALLDIFNRSRDKSRDNLNYFAQELLQVRADLDLANAALRDYAIDNSLQSSEELARASAQLAQVRRDLIAVDESVAAVNSIDFQEFSGARYSQEFPITNSVAFRRLFDFSSNPLEWQAPNESAVEAALGRLKSQRTSLVSSLAALRARAARSGAEALELSALEREAEVQQAIYESVITQFEAQSLFSGLESASGRVIELAIAPNSPTSPKKRLVLVVGGIMGLVLGTLAIIGLKAYRGTIHTYSGVKDGFDVENYFLLDSSTVGVPKNSKLPPKQKNVFEEMSALIDDDVNIVAILPLRKKRIAAESIAFGLAKSSPNNESKIAILLLAAETHEVTAVAGKERHSIFSIHGADEGFNVLVPRNAEDFLLKAKVAAIFADLKEHYDKVFVVFPDAEKNSAMQWVVGKHVSASIFVSGRGSTRKTDLDFAKSLSKSLPSSNSSLVVL